MLAARHRLRRRADFGAAVRSGRRAARPTLVVHLMLPASPPDPSRPAPPARAGFVVSKAVGPSVVRHRVSRQLRHLVAARLARLSPGTDLVVRALPASAAAGSDRLGHDLDRALDRVLGAAA